MNRREALRRIVVIGGGPTGWCAAIGFARALPGAEVTLLPLPPPPDALADRLPAIGPDAIAMLAQMGVDETALIASGAATHRVGERFAWGGDPFAIGDGEGVPSLAGAALHQLWLTHGEGAFGALVPGAVLAEAERFVHPVDDPRSLLSCIDYHLRLNGAKATQVFAQIAAAARIRVAPVVSIAVERAGDTIAAIEAGGTRWTADLFVDASGPAALLAPPDTRWIDWSDSLSVDRLLLKVEGARPSPVDRYEVTGSGWAARWPSGTQTLAAFAYSSATTTDARARRQFGDGERIVVRARRRAQPYAGNVLALGDAAVATGPLGWWGLPLALSNLSLALELMPARTSEPLLIAEYNRRATLRADRIHAYIAAFYLAGTRRSGDFWHAMRTRAAPDELATALAQFGQRGTLPPLEEEMVPRVQWRQALIGLGLRPVRHDPVALSIPRASATASLAQLRAAVASLPGQLPPYPAYLAAMMRETR